MAKEEKTPKEIEDKDLDEASGGLSAVQKTGELELSSDTIESDSSHSGGANYLFGDGSVRF